MEPFRDTTVLDLSTAIAGPLTTHLLGSLGAEVVKVEPPDGDVFRGALAGSMFPAFNAGKRSISLDLKTDEGRRIAGELAGEADVVVESFRPGVLERFDLDFASVADRNPGVVYLSISGFGQDGPYRDRPGYDPIMQAMSGLMATTGHPDRLPARVGTSVIDVSTGLLGFGVVASAIHEARRSGRGRHVDLALYEVALQLMSYWIARYTGTGRVPARSGTGFEGMCPNDLYFAADDEPFYLVVPGDRMFRRLCSVLDREELAGDVRFEDNERRCANRADLREALNDTFGEYQVDDLIETLTDAGIPAGPLRDVGAVVDDDPQAAARGMLAPSRNLHLDEPVEIAAPPFRIDDVRPSSGGRPPALGEHTEAILARLGYDEAEREELLGDGVVRSA